MVTRIIFIASFCGVIASAQQASSGKYYPAPTPYAVPIYSGQQLGNSGFGATSPQTFAFGSIPAGSSIFGIISFANGNTVAISITSFTGTSGTLTFTTATQALTAGQLVVLGSFTAGNVGLNGQTVTVLSGGLTTTQFEAVVTGSGYSSGAGSESQITAGDGTGTCGLTGTDTAIFQGGDYVNSGDHTDYVFYIVNTATTQSSLQICWTGTTGGYAYAQTYQVFGIGGIDTNATGSGYVRAQSTSNGTLYTSPSITTAVTGAPGDVLIGMQSNGSGGTMTCTTSANCGDNQGNVFAINSANNNGVVTIITLVETTNNTFHCQVTGPSAHWNMHCFAFKPAAQGGIPVNYNSNGRNYVQAQGGNGTFYGGSLSPSCLVDFSAGTNGNAPTQTDVYNGIRGNSTCLTSSTKVIVSAIGSGYKYTNAQQPIKLYTPSLISGVGYAGNSGLGVGGLTDGTAIALNAITLQTSAAGTSASLGYTFYTDCPGTIGLDCAAEGGLFGGPNYVVSHFRQFGSCPAMCVVMENQSGGTPIYNPIPTATAYRINLQQNSSGMNHMIICDANNRMIYTWSMPAGTNVGDQVSMGISGEEPAVAGYHYYWWNYTMNFSGTFNPNGPCF